MTPFKVLNVDGKQEAASLFARGMSMSDVAGTLRVSRRHVEQVVREAMQQLVESVRVSTTPKGL